MKGCRWEFPVDTAGSDKEGGNLGHLTIIGQRAIREPRKINWGLSQEGVSDLHSSDCGLDTFPHRAGFCPPGLPCPPRISESPLCEGGGPREGCGEPLTLPALTLEPKAADNMSSWSQGFLSFDPFQTLASSGISVFRLRQREKSGSRKVRAFGAGRAGLGCSSSGHVPRPGLLCLRGPHAPPISALSQARVWEPGKQAQVTVASGGVPPRGQRGQQGFMGKDLSATGEDILPAFPSSCGRSPRPRFSSAGGPPLSQLGCLITPPVLLLWSRVLIPGRPRQLPGTADCTHSCRELSLCQGVPPPHPRG